MSSLWKYCMTTINKEDSSPTPTVRRILSPCNILLPVKFLKIADFIKRISLLILPGTSVRASMTVETALVLPLFCLFMIYMGSAIEMIRLHGNLEVALWDVGRQIGIYGGLLDTEKCEDSREEDSGDRLGTVALSYTYVKNRIVHQLGEEYLGQSPLEQGTESLQFLESSTRGDNYEIIVTYKVSPVTEILGFRGFRMANRYYGHLWNGYEIPGTEEAGEYVYVTEDSAVYHISRECTHLRLSVRPVGMAEVPGGYRPCEKCIGGKTNELVPGGGIYYICTEGKSYHSRRDCPGLKRTIYCIAKEAAKGYRKCSRCGKT